MSKFAILTALIVIGSLSFLVLVYHKYGDIQVSVVQPIPFDQPDRFLGNDVVGTYTLLDLLWPVLSICLVGTIIFTFFFSLIVSHRMAGPVYRMRQLLEEMAQGDLSRPVSRLRKKDEFKHLFSDINNVKEHWRLQIGELQCICREFGEDGNQEKEVQLVSLQVMGESHAAPAPELEPSSQTDPTAAPETPKAPKIKNLNPSVTP